MLDKLIEYLEEASVEEKIISLFSMFIMILFFFVLLVDLTLICYK